MKLIIDIPKELKQKIDEGFTNQVIINKLWDATKNGIPLEQIRAEIADLDDAEYEFEGYYKAVNDAVQIIDKYR